MDDFSRWQELVRNFGLDKPGVEPWDAELLDGSFAGASHGEKCVIRFLLNVWNPAESWSCGPFDVLGALSVWDAKQRLAFLEWAAEPWWP